MKAQVIKGTCKHDAVIVTPEDARTKFQRQDGKTEDFKAGDMLHSSYHKFYFDGEKFHEGDTLAGGWEVVPAAMWSFWENCVRESRDYDYEDIFPRDHMYIEIPKDATMIVDEEYQRVGMKPDLLALRHHMNLGWSATINGIRYKTLLSEKAGRNQYGSLLVNDWADYHYGRNKSTLSS